MNTKAFQDKYGPWAVVTGAASGIGRALAKGLVEKGLNVILVGRSVNALDDFSAELRSMNNRVDTRVLVTDLADEHSVDSIVEFAKEFDVGLLIASAGFGSSGVFLENPLDSELEMLAVNCRSLLELTWHFGNRFSQRGRGGLPKRLLQLELERRWAARLTQMRLHLRYLQLWGGEQQFCLVFSRNYWSTHWHHYRDGAASISWVAS